MRTNRGSGLHSLDTLPPDTLTTPQKGPGTRHILPLRKGPGTRDTQPSNPREQTHACENITFPSGNSFERRLQTANVMETGSSDCCYICAKKNWRGIRKRENCEEKCWLFQVKKIPAVLLEETEEDRLQKECDICRKPVFSFIMRRHMESHARKAAENAARVNIKP